jgi:hypothetical protein
LDTKVIILRLEVIRGSIFYYSFGTPTR